MQPAITTQLKTPIPNRGVTSHLHATRDIWYQAKSCLLLGSLANRYLVQTGAFATASCNLVIHTLLWSIDPRSCPIQCCKPSPCHFGLWPLYVSPTLINHHVCMPISLCQSYYLLSCFVCLVISIWCLSVHRRTDAHPNFVSCLGTHDTKVLLSTPNEPDVCKALPCLTWLSHAPLCLYQFDHCCGFPCHPHVSLVCSDKLWHYTHSLHSCAQGIVPLC